MGKRINAAIFKVCVGNLNENKHNIFRPLKLPLLHL